MSTTNGTRAIAAARQAGRMYIGALINAAAVARRLVEQHDNIILLCAGTGGRIALEDILGAGAVIHHMQNLSQPGQLTLATDTARIALRLFQSAQHDLGAALRDSQGGRNVMAVNLPEDVEYAARLDQLDVVGEVDRERMVVRRLT